MSQAALDLQVSHTVIICCHEKCGIAFSVPQWWEQRRREDKTWWYCPNGHSQHFSGKTEAERLKGEVERLNKDAAYLRTRLEDEAKTVNRLCRSRDSYKGQVTRIKNRVSKGVCPCCNRTFQNLARHMTGQHPEWKGQDIG